MTYLFGSAGRAALRRVAIPTALLVFDYDGTLTPLVATPGKARLSRAGREKFHRLARICPRIAVLSGRALDDLLPRLRGLPLAGVVGNHGAEWMIRGRRGRNAAGANALVRSRQEVAAIGPAVARALEDKGLSYSVHLGRLSPAVRRSILSVVDSQSGVRRFAGAQTTNVVPAHAPNKGDALRRLERALRPSAVFFVGDDRSDEDAFSVRFDAPFFAVRVGKRQASAADAFLKSQGQIDRLLDELSLEIATWPGSR
jgi:trehalose 6-phosphate phosphatase